MNTLALGTAQRANRLGVHRKRPTSPYADKVRSIFGGNLVEHWPLWEAAGTVAAGLAHGYNGAASGVQWGQAGAGDGRSAAFYSGTAGSINLFTPALTDAFNGQELSISLWFKVTTAAVWNDNVSRRIVTFQQDGNNRVMIVKNPLTGVLFSYLAGGTTKAVTRPVAGTTANWTHVAITVSKSADAVKAYWNGVQEQTTQTALGTWPAGLMQNAWIGAQNATTAMMDGWIQHVAYGNRALTAAEVAALAVVP